jgi:hypothetical protein
VNARVKPSCESNSKSSATSSTFTAPSRNASAARVSRSARM